MYTFGDKFLINNTTYILSSINHKQIALISLVEGFTRRPPVTIEDISTISKYEMEMACGTSEFTELSNDEFITRLINPVNPVYKFGQRFTSCNDEFILARVGESQAALVSLIDGNRWKNVAEIDLIDGAIDEKNFLKIIGEEHKDRFKTLN